MKKNTLQPFPWQLLIDWYGVGGRHHLPWREYEHIELGYRIWLSEILLQQTQVDRVIPFYTRMLDRYPTITDLAQASYEEFFPYYQGLGYYSRARNILKTAVIVSTEYRGVFPRDKKLLMKLPGVGGYTSSAILAFAYGESCLSWDTNLEKVFARYYHGSRFEKLSEVEKDIVEKDFGRFTAGNPETIRAINNALMDFAATVDLKNPSTIDWINYPIQSGVWYDTRGSLEPQETKISQSFPIPDATVIVILHQDHKIYYSTHSGDPEKQSKISRRPSRKQMNSVEMTGTPIPYILSPTSYSPFILPPSLTRDTRRYVQDFFREQYGLELSVRPIHRKWFSKDGKPYIAVNAQIQAGDASVFRTYGKSDMRPTIEKLYSL